MSKIGKLFGPEADLLFIFIALQIPAVALGVWNLTFVHGGNMATKASIGGLDVAAAAVVWRALGGKARVAIVSLLTLNAALAFVTAWH